MPVAQRLAAALGSELHLVRVVPPTVMAGEPGYGYVSPELIEAVQEAAESYVADMQKTTQAKEAATFLGPPADLLLDYIKEHSIDLVVMTTHGRGGLLRVALGSVADRLIGGTAPVFLVRAGEPAA